jgi:hypothetical protein
VRLASTLRSFGLVVLMAASLASPAQAGLLWYNGDYDSRGSLTNETNVPINTGSGFVIQNSLVYDNFVVPVGQTWTITSVFSNDFVAYPNAAISTATWQIRSGVSAGKGGSLVASGDTAATVTALPNTLAGFTAETVTASVPSVVLTAGTYWLAVAPDSAGFFGDQSFVMTTSGANSIGTPAGNDGNSFISNTFPTASALNFAATTSVLNNRSQNLGPNIDFSMGVIGTAVVPEPSSAILVAVGLLGPLALSMKRRLASSR